MLLFYCNVLLTVTIFSNATPDKDGSRSEWPRTPKLEDFGLSSLTLSACKQPERTQVFAYPESNTNR